MDPFIEGGRLWEPFHFGLIGEIERALADRLPAHYAVGAGERTYIEYLDPAGDGLQQRLIQPDVSVTSTATGAASAAVAAPADPAAVRMHGLVRRQVREPFLEIRDLDRGGRLVTGIEVLSPANKRAKSRGWGLYQRKRDSFFRGAANFVEIDLLRRGRRHPMQESWPDSPFYVLTMRKAESPACTVTPACCTQTLPKIAVPLLPHDHDIELEMQPLVDAVYRRGRYEQRIDYGLSLRPPLSPEETDLLDARLRERPGAAG